jgi:hypothetical protein
LEGRDQGGYQPDGFAVLPTGSGSWWAMYAPRDLRQADYYCCLAPPRPPRIAPGSGLIIEVITSGLGSGKLGAAEPAS